MLDRIREINGDYGRKTLALTVISAVITPGFTAFNLYTAVIGGALWYYALAAYYFVLLLYRMSALTAVAVCRKRYGSGDERYDGARRRIGLYCGVVLLLLEIAMAVVVTITTIYPRDAAMGTIPAIATATFTFYKLTMAIINAVKAKRLHDPVAEALRAATLADACMAIASLTVVMLASFGGGDDSASLALKALAGFAACAATITIAVCLIRDCCSQARKNK